MPPSPSSARPHLPPRGLYAVTDGRRDDLVAAARAALQGGAVIVQYRDKSHDRARRLHEARALVELCCGFDVPLIVNDDVELAEASGAAGVHLGEDDADVAAARARLGPGAIIGASCYDSLRRARAAVDAGSDYLAFGSPFASTTKPEARGAAASILGEARALGRPVVVIGGITPDNARSLIESGADFLAVVSGVFSAPDICVAARKYARLFTTD